ncbi:hypothetical protein GGI35DRAFT_443479 [Trichoderma velutinum]
MECFAPIHSELYSKLSVAFYPDSQGDSCEAKDINRTIIFTTHTVPEANTCFNLSDIFSQNSSSGFQKSRQQSYDDEPLGVS